MQPIEFLRQTPPFDALDEEALQLAVRSLKIVHYPAEARILERGSEPSHYLYIVRRGVARLEQEGETVLVLEEGDLFGFPSLLSQKAPVFDVITEEPALIYQLPEDVFRKLMGRSDFADYFLQSLSERLRRASALHPQSALAFGDFAAPVVRLIKRAPVLVHPGVTVAEAARVMHEHGVSSVLVTGDPMGIVTVRDLRSRVLARERSPSTPVAEVMTSPLHTFPAHGSIAEALITMIELGIHHLPVEREGRIVGVVTDTDLMRQQIRNPLVLFERVKRLDHPTERFHYDRDIAAAVDWLFHNGLDVIQMGRVIARLNDALIGRLLELAEKALGPPPTPYAWFVFGSEGRMEQILLTDQDNALAYAEASPEADAYFARLAEWVVHALTELGFPPCRGGYMATHWRRPLDEWVRLFRSWVLTPDPQALMEVGIFFDYRRVRGELSLASLDEEVRKGGDNHIFLAHMARAAQGWQPPLGFLRRIRGEQGRVDIKRGGIAPIVALARVYALEAHASVRPTIERLQVAREQDILSPEGAETLEESFRFLMRLRLRAQLEALHRGEAPDNVITLKSLSALERRMLKEAFLAVREMQNALRFRYQTDLLG
ncbi:MAG TPA: cyclic nucleotide-binding/CBS domain-containing protein [Anaerolineae bacterium]|nr:cyclic nucleotide-binding/CBS domain-containing protein [Caldilineae bacterium]HID35197.1 cyclic nucleotide-binding/CBS domain-containing protein [Anaerolineae bacterium]HIQ12477.1 cyclic nucleotide-binding/CBS domain-containing protein [Caldilineales bacterium]